MIVGVCSRRCCELYLRGQAYMQWEPEHKMAAMATKLSLADTGSCYDGCIGVNNANSESYLEFLAV